MENYKDGYYHFGKDLEDYPEACFYIIWSRRGPGKTYSALRYAKEHNIQFMYVKRTNDDVEMICTRGGNQEEYNNKIDMSPFVPLNRDFGWRVMPFFIHKGFGGFWETDDDGNQVGKPVAYLASLNAIKSVKGFEASNCDWILLDEFIPQVGEVVKRKEGEMLLDLYMTVLRDRQKKGKEPVKLILFANAENISTPITRELEVIDDMAKMQATGQSKLYLANRDIFLHHITTDEVPLQDNEKRGIYKAMAGTSWAAKALEGEFANNDFTNVMRLSLKNMRPVVQLTYKKKPYYIWYHDDKQLYYMCRSKGKCSDVYDLDLENDQKLFWSEWGIDLRSACIDDCMKFQTYTMYDLIVNYKKLFEL